MRRAYTRALLKLSGEALAGEVAPRRAGGQEPCGLVAGEMDRARVVPGPLRGRRSDRDDRDGCFAPQRAGADRFEERRDMVVRERDRGGRCGKCFQERAGHVRGVAGVRIGEVIAAAELQTQHLGLAGARLGLQASDRRGLHRRPIGVARAIDHAQIE